MNCFTNSGWSDSGDQSNVWRKRLVWNGSGRMGKWAKRPEPFFWSGSICNIWAVARQNKQTDMCPKRRLRSAWASTQSDQSLSSLHEENLGPKLPAKTDQTGPMPKLIWIFAGRTCHFVGSVVLWLIWFQIAMCECPNFFITENWLFTGSYLVNSIHYF